MSSPFYTGGGHSLAAILRERLEGARTLSMVQDELARQIVSGEIVILPPLPKGWWLQRTGDPRRIVIATYGERHDAWEYRCHFPQKESRLSNPHQVPIAEQPQLVPAVPARPKAPEEWLAEAVKAHPRQRGEQMAIYARRLHRLMEKQAAALTKHWEMETLKRRLYDLAKKPPAESPGQKRRR